MKNKSIMLQGTASNVGKSLLCTALCRIFTEDGYNVNPFKSQNMSLNSYITAEGGEMGRAQVAQAEACYKLPHTDMNPILLKPSTDKKSQIILNGKVFGNMKAMEYFKFKPNLKPEIEKTYKRLSDRSDIVVLEGAGSPAEINLKENDIVNMGMAEIANAPVILVGDIDKGGVFASLAGTIMLLTEEERKRVKGIIINKFRGDVSLLKSGLVQIEEITGVPVLGVVPMVDVDIEDEDSEADFLKYSKNKTGNIDIAVIKLPYISNFTDINALALEKNVNIRFVDNYEELENPDIIILPGTKSTINAVKFLKDKNLFNGIKEAYEKGTFVFGICGGYQLMGKAMYDEYSAESEEKFAEGLGILDIETYFEKEKTTVLSNGIENIFSEPVKGYEIHMGTEKKGTDVKSFIKFENGSDGAISENGRAMGTYFHGIFDNGKFTRKFVNMVRREKGVEEYNGDIVNFSDYKESQYNKLAKIVRESIDMEKIYSIVREGI